MDLSKTMKFSVLVSAATSAVWSTTGRPHVRSEGDDEVTPKHCTVGTEFTFAGRPAFGAHHAVAHQVVGGRQHHPLGGPEPVVSLPVAQGDTRTSSATLTPPLYVRKEKLSSRLSFTSCRQKSGSV
jgi:hypothetical protein